MSCKTGLSDLGSDQCVTPDIVRKVIFVKYFDAAGLPQGIDLSSPFGETEIDALLNQTDVEQRWLLTEELSNVVSERADPNVETIDNVDYFISQGARPMTADLLTVNADISTKINANRSTQLGAYLVDQNGGIVGDGSREGFLDPIRLSQGSMWAKVVMATEANIFKVSMSFNWSKFAKDGDLRVLTEGTTGTDMLAKRPLIYVNENASDSVLATTATVSYASVDGTASGLAFTGLVVGDFAMFNSTTQLAVVPTLAAEGPEGTYLLTFPAQGSNELGTIDVTKSGYTFETANITFL
jgi:hypothetical protein